MIRKDLWPKVKAARQAGQRAFLRYDKIVLYDQEAATDATAASATVIANGILDQLHEERADQSRPIIEIVGDQSDQS